MTVIRTMTPEDWPAVHTIYAEGIAPGHATFDSEPPTWDQFNTSRHGDLRLVAEHEGAIIGWAAASPVSARDVYAGVVEDSVYVGDGHAGQGVGRTLLKELLQVAEAIGIWTVQASIFPENQASIRLHEQTGFRTVGTRERIALMRFGPLAGRWRNTVLLERRFTSRE